MSEVYIHTYIHTHIRTHTYTHTYIRMHICVNFRHLSGMSVEPKGRGRQDGGPGLKAERLKARFASGNREDWD
jgi:hypothetical protein